MLSLNTCRAKLWRAKEHSAALDSLRAKTVGDEANKPAVGLKRDRESGDYILYISRCPDYTSFLIEASLILGDAIHNLRGALDHLVYHLAYWHKAGNVVNERVTQFPICDGPAAFEQERIRRLGELHPNHVAVIERFQPYHPVGKKLDLGYKHPLWVIRELSNADKHRLLNVVVIPTNVMILRPPFEHNEIARRGGYDLPQTAILGARLERYTFVEGVNPPDMEVIGHIPAQIAVTGVALRYPIEWALPLSLIATAEKIIEKFEPLCVG